MAKKKKGNVVTVDFTGIEAGGVAIPEGKYEVGVVAVSQETGNDSGKEYLAFEFAVSSGKQKGKKLYLNKSLQQNSLWSLRGLLEVLGVEIPDDTMDIDLDDLVDRTCGVEVQHEQYNGKNRAQITDVFEVVEEDEKPAEDEEAPKKKKSKQDDENEEEDEPAKKKAKKDDEDESDEEEDEKPAKKKKGKKSKTYTEDSVLENDEEELQALIDEHELEVDLEEFNTLRRKRAAVIEALNEAGMIE